MRWSIRIARIAGIDLKIHLTFLLLLAWIGIAHSRQGGAAAAGAGILFVLLLFACVVLHEFGHALAARRYGIRTADITLLPIGGVARILNMPKNPRQELVIALAGPAVNVGIAIVLFALIGGGQGRLVGDVLALEDVRVALVSKLLTVNVWLVLFNLIPAFPMDGGRILRSLLAMRMPYARATEIAAGVGQSFAFLFGFIGLFSSNPLLIFIALFVYLGATQEASIAHIRDISERLPVSVAMITDFRVLGPDSTLNDAVELLLRTAQHEFPVVSPVGRLAGVLTRDDLIAALKRLGPDAPVSQVMRTDVPEVSSTTPFEAAFELMSAQKLPMVVVTGEDGQPAGIVTPENIGELLLVHAAFRRPPEPRRRGSDRIRNP